jgi:hypothetical protein
MTDEQTERDACVVYTNTDLTEGRGTQYPMCVCDIEATAIRLAKGKGVMGTNAEVRDVTLINVNGEWFGPVVVTPATREDTQAQTVIDARREAIARAKAAGLTDDDLRALGV